MTEHERWDDDEADRTVDELRQVLVRDAPLRPGLATSLHARVRRRRRSRANGTAGERIVLGALVFSAAALGRDAATVAAAAMATALYVWLVEIDDGVGEENAPMNAVFDR